MNTSDPSSLDRLPLSRSQRNLYSGVLQDARPDLYLIGKSYRFRPIELPRFLTALEATALASPVQLCVLQAGAAPDEYPDLVPRLQFADIVRVRAVADRASNSDDERIDRTWLSGILDKPLVRYTVWTDESGQVSALDADTHHILIDGGATWIIESDLARYLTGDDHREMPSIEAGLTKLIDAHRREAEHVDDSAQRLSRVVHKELADEARHSDHGRDPETRSTAAKGILCESVTVSGESCEALLALSNEKQIPLNILVAAAAVAVDASLRQSTECLLVHAVDNRFGDPYLGVATCLVNSIAHSVRFPPFASVADVVRSLDRGYVKAVRRRWIREEHFRRMYMAVNRTTHADALTLNFIRDTCAPDLRPFLLEPPTATDIGPVEGMTVAGVLNEPDRVLTLSIWNRADLPTAKRHVNVARRIADALESLAVVWDKPLAMTVGEWIGVGVDGTPYPATQPAPPAESPSPAWFLGATAGIPQLREQHRHIDQWIAWLVHNDIAPGTVLVFTDDNTDKTSDLLLACHLAGCSYSVCDRTDEIHTRTTAIVDHGGGIVARVVDVAGVELAAVDDGVRSIVDRRIDYIVRDAALADATAYLMPTSGSTGQPKLVQVAHRSLAQFCEAARIAYGWRPDDTVLQCAPLTSDISVEEIFVAATAGAKVIRSQATRTGDLEQLGREILAEDPTIVDLPTAIWHLICEDDHALSNIRRSRLRHAIIGGEAVRSSAVDRWVEAVGTETMSLISTYGPTETTVVVTYLPIVQAENAIDGRARLRLGRPLVAETVFVAFGEVVVVGDLVSSGYLGPDGHCFGHVIASCGSQVPAFATADRVVLDDEGFYVFAGRRDAVVKIAGKRVDTAEVVNRISADPDVCDLAVELHQGRLGVWFESHRTRRGGDDDAAAARIRLTLAGLRVSSFFVVGLPSVPRKANGKIDGARLPVPHEPRCPATDHTDSTDRSNGLVEIWNRHLDRNIGPNSSLLDEGIGSLDLIRILPDSRTYLGRHISLLDLISADTAANLADLEPTIDDWMDAETAASIERDFTSLTQYRTPTRPVARRAPQRSAAQRIVVLGASGILGTGFAQAFLDRKRSGIRCPEVVFVARAELPHRGPWPSLRDMDGIRIQRLTSSFGPAELAALVGDRDAGTVVNCIGNTNVLVPYRDLRFANLELVETLSEICADRSTRLVHLSTFVVNAEATAPWITDPREAPYPYAASKALAELAVSGSTGDLDFALLRLPRVLGEDYQLRDSADILVSVTDACRALGAYPSVTLTEEVTTGRAAAHSVLNLLPELGGPAQLGRRITVVRGQQVRYAEFFKAHVADELDAIEWKIRLDQSDWARRNPRRWSVVDAWITLGMRLGGRSYSEYLSDYPTTSLAVASISELVTEPQPVETVIDAALESGPAPIDSDDEMYCGTAQ